MRKGVQKGAVLTAVTLLIGSCFFVNSVAADTNTTTGNSTNSTTNSTTSTPAASGNSASTGASSGASAAGGKVTFPGDSDFQVVAQTPTLILKADPKTGHFILDDKRNGNEYSSYPDPAQYGNGPDSASAAQRIVSPLRFGYIDLTNKKPQANESSFLEEVNSDSSKQTKIADWKQIDGGFQFTFQMPAKQLTIPVQVRIQDDYLETKVIDAGIKENKYSLVWLMLYPAFSADKSTGQDGYLFIPDGSGTMINFQPNRGQVSNYQ
ncbi:MAG: hypothetical protein JWN30_2450, partial [Bacilli bacterium]|nr:hypothetical protein [Bacilli bacterium]